MIRPKLFHSYLFMLSLFLFSFSDSWVYSTSDTPSETLAVGKLIQSDSLSQKELVERIKLATEKFKDPEAARTAGYRPLGPDMPNMGVHWIHTGIAVQRSIDFERPSTLTYLPVDGALRLTGVAYTAPVKAGEKAPKLPGEIMSWHYHSGNLEKEAHGVHNEEMQKDEESRMNLAMLHAWVWSENPDGIFSADNWALSFERFGLVPPDTINPDVSKALFLASGNVDYYLKFIELSLEPEIINMNQIRPVILDYSLRIKTRLISGAQGKCVTDRLQKEINDIWQKMWMQIKQGLNQTQWEKIESNLHTHHHN